MRTQPLPACGAWLSARGSILESCARGEVQWHPVLSAFGPHDPAQWGMISVLLTGKLRLRGAVTCPRSWSWFVGSGFQPGPSDPELVLHQRCTWSPASWRVPPARVSRTRCASPVAPEGRPVEAANQRLRDSEGVSCELGLSRMSQTLCKEALGPSRFQDDAPGERSTLPPNSLGSHPLRAPAPGSLSVRNKSDLPGWALEFPETATRPWAGAQRHCKRDTQGHCHASWPDLGPLPTASKKPS